MPLSSDAIDEFRAAWRDATQEEISAENARVYAERILEFVGACFLSRLSTDQKLDDSERSLVQ